MSSYTYNESIDILEKYFKKYISDQDKLDEFLTVLEESRKRQTVPIRGISEMYLNYQKNLNKQIYYDDEESIAIRKMWQELFDHWD